MVSQDPHGPRIALLCVISTSVDLWPQLIPPLIQLVRDLHLWESHWRSYSRKTLVYILSDWSTAVTPCLQQVQECKQLDALGHPPLPFTTHAAPPRRHSYHRHHIERLLRGFIPAAL